MENEKILYDSTDGILKYQVADTIYNNRPSRVLFGEDRIAAESGIALDDNKEMLFDYNERFMEIIRGLQPKRILLIGGGAFTLPKAINEEFPEVKLDVVELDVELYKIAQKYFNFKPNKNTKIYIKDGNEYLKTTRQIYDLVIVDVFLNNVIPESFRTKKFAKRLKRILTDEGIVAMNIIASYYGKLSSFINNITSAYSSSFETVQIFPADIDLSLWISQNFIITAQNNNINIQPFVRYKALNSPKPSWRQWLIN